MKPKDLSALILLGAVWGLSFIFIRVGVPQLGPFFLMVLRVGLAFSGVRPLTLATGLQAGATALLLPFAVATVPGEAPSAAAALSALGLAIFCTAVAYLLYFTLIRNVGPTSTLTVTFLAPGFGVLFGVLLLGEPFGFGMALGLAIVLLGVALVTGIGFGRAGKKGAVAGAKVM